MLYVLIRTSIRRLEKSAISFRSKIPIAKIKFNRGIQQGLWTTSSKLLWAGAAVGSLWLSLGVTICDKFRPSLVQRVLDIVYAGTDHYGTIPDDEEDAVNATGGHWAYGEITFNGLQALLQYMEVDQSSVFYDFGSGLGKVVVQCFLTSGARKVVGIEMAGTRHLQAWQASERMGKLVELIDDARSHVLLPPLSDSASGSNLVHFGFSSWFQEQPECDEALSPSFVLRCNSGTDQRELRLIHGDCLKVSRSLPISALRALPHDA